MIYYICHYTHPKIADEERIAAPAAINKGDYIIKALSQIYDEPIEVVTLSGTKAKRRVDGKKIPLSDHITLKTFLSWNSERRFLRILGYFCTKIISAIYLLTHVNHKDYLISYHSLSSMKLVNFVKLIKRCQLTVEVEELYSDVHNDSALRKKEISCIQKADNYIFITKLLDEKINVDEKPTAIAHGTYQVVLPMVQKTDSIKTRVLYAGNLRRVKGGAYDAVKAAAYLNEYFSIDIMGNGTEEEIRDIKDLIKSVSIHTKCEVCYIGFQAGDAFNACVQTYDIGLSTQDINGSFSHTSFPSKIMMYMSNGLKVVGPRIPAIETSDVAGHVFYYESSDPSAVATAIRCAAESNVGDSREILKKLDIDFKASLLKLIS